jgi:hypothetical protein
LAKRLLGYFDNDKDYMIEKNGVVPEDLEKKLTPFTLQYQGCSAYAGGGGSLRFARRIKIGGSMTYYYFAIGLTSFQIFLEKYFWLQERLARK